MSTGRFKYKDLKLLDNKTLGCYCAPNRCHGDNYKMLLDEMNKYFKVIVAGSRNYNNKEFIYNKLDILLSKVNKISFYFRRFSNSRGVRAFCL